MNRQPLKVDQNYYNLLGTGQINSSLITFNNVGLTSERAVTVCDNKSMNGQLFTVNLSSKQISVRANKAEAVLPHPTLNIDAVRAKMNDGTTQVHVYNMDNKTKILTSTVREVVKFWTWINNKTIGIVGNSGVYLIKMNNFNQNNNVEPEKIGQREGILSGQQGPVQIIGMSLCPTGTFFAINGLSKNPQTNQIEGNIQLCSIKQQKSQFLKGYAQTFIKTRVVSNFDESNLFCYVEKNSNSQGKIIVSEIDQPVDPNKRFKVFIDMPYGNDQSNDFPVSIQANAKLSLLFVFTKMGYMFLFEISEGSMILRSKISDQSVITSCSCSNSVGALVLNKNGSLISIIVDEPAFADFLSVSMHIKNNQQIEKKIRFKSGLPGSEQAYLEAFNQAYQMQDIDKIAKIAMISPGQVIRNYQNIEKLKQLPKPQNGPFPILKYFYVILENGKLNEIETNELSSLVLQQQKIQMIQKWFQEDKLTLNEQLGDLVAQYDKLLAEKIYTAINSPKVMSMKIQRGEIDSVVGSARPDDLLNQLKTLAQNDPQTALNFAKAMAKSNRLPVNMIAEILLNASLINELTSFCLEYLPNTPESSNWQTLILETNLKTNPSCAESIFQTSKWNQYIKSKIAPICESKGLYIRALENYQDLKDIKRVLLNNISVIQPELIQSYFINNLQSDYIIPLLSEYLKYNRNIRLAVEIGQQVYNKVGIKELVDLYEQQGAYDGVYYFLGPLLQKTNDKLIYHKFIESCAKCSQLTELEKVIQQCSSLYDPEEVLNILLNTKLQDPKCLIILCDQNNFIKEMVKYLWENNCTQHIEMYILRVNRDKAGDVLGTLIDLGAEENYIRQLLNTMGGNCNIQEVVQQFDERNRLRLLESWLEQRIQEGSTLKEVHNSMAKLAVDFDRQPEQFLTNNKFYDSKEIGHYSETRDPHLAYLAYSRDFGQNDDEIIQLTNKNGLFRLQAQYLVKRQSKQLWAQALDDNNQYKQSVVDQVVSFALSESKSVDEVSSTVQAFMAANMPNDLQGLLEKLVMHSEFSQYKKLQNLLITTSMRTDKSRVIDYLNKLDNYDNDEILNYLLSDEYRLYEEALIILKKTNRNLDYINILIDKMDQIERANEFAEKTNQPDVWSKLGQGYLNKQLLDQAIDCFIKAQDPQYYIQVISLSQEVQHYEKLIEYLIMARKTKKEMSIDNELVYSYAKLNRNNDIEALLTGSQQIDLPKMGDRLYNEGYYQQAQILYQKLKANAKIASCYIKLMNFNLALEYAQKANNIKTYKEIVYSCLQYKEYKMASIACLQVILVPDHLEEIVQYYELHQQPNEIIQVLEQALTNEKAHIGMFTELGILYSKYQQSKLFDFIKAYFHKLNVTKLIRICNKQQLWKEVVYLHSNYKEYDMAVMTIMDHSPVCYDHDTFISNLSKISNSELYYRAINFYLDEQPMRLNELLKQLSPKLNSGKVVEMIKRQGAIPLIFDWLKSIQGQNVLAVNDALNEIYLELEDFDSLRQSIQNYDQIDALSLAQRIQNNDNLEFRRISALLYRRNQKYKESIELSIKDQNYKDAIETAKESKNQELIKNLMLQFAQNGNKEFFCVCTFECFDLLPLEFVLETSWRYKLIDYSMPYMIMQFKNLSNKLDCLQKKFEEQEKKEEEKNNKEANKKIELNNILNSGNAMLSNGMPMIKGPSNYNSSFPQAQTSFVPNATQSMNMPTMGNNMGQNNKHVMGSFL